MIAALAALEAEHARITVRAARCQAQLVAERAAQVAARTRESSTRIKAAKAAAREGAR